jgi:hydrogenase-4 component F
MIETALIAIPLLAALTALAWPGQRSRRWLLPVTGALHAAFTLWLLVARPVSSAAVWFGFDPLARAVLPMVSLLFLICAAYSATYLDLRRERRNRVFVAALLALLGLLSLALQAQNLGLLWVAAEAATLTTVPLLHFNRTARAFEATWKYLLLGSTGIALSLLGSFCLGYASLHGSGSGDLTFAGLAARSADLSRPWLVAAWVLLLAGYGTKMGLAPMHTWKPDAYGEAPGVVGALMAGGLTTVAFVAVLRVKQVVDAAGEAAMSERTLLTIGLFSMFVAALFLLGTRDFKRMLAYSSIEQMGILSVGAALGPAGLAAALFHVWNNGLAKGALFLSAGNIRRAAGGRTMDEVAGMTWRTPISTKMFVAGTLVITALPPFGPFFSVVAILRSSLEEHHEVIAAVFLGSLLLAFLGLTRLVFAIVDGRPRAGARSLGGKFRETPGIIMPPLVCLALLLWLGLSTPSVLRDAWSAAAHFLAVTP